MAPPQLNKLGQAAMMRTFARLGAMKTHSEALARKANLKAQDRRRARRAELVYFASTHAKVSTAPATTFPEPPSKVVRVPTDLAERIMTLAREVSALKKRPAPRSGRMVWNSRCAKMWLPALTVGSVINARLPAAVTARPHPTSVSSSDPAVPVAQAFGHVVASPSYDSMGQELPQVLPTAGGRSARAARIMARALARRAQKTTGKGSRTVTSQDEFAMECAEARFYEPAAAQTVPAATSAEECKPVLDAGMFEYELVMSAVNAAPRMPFSMASFLAVDRAFASGAPASSLAVA